MRPASPFAFCLLPFALQRQRRGQALLIAVLVLFAVGTLGALFAAIIGAQLTQVTRQSDVVALRNIAEAGLRLANEELTYSPLGADWRPKGNPYLCGEGQVTIQVSYGPSPDQLQSRFLRVLSTAVFPDNPFLRHTILALKPALLTDYARFITDRFDTGQAAALGVSGVELGGAARPDYVSAIEGPVRSNTDLVWYGRSVLSLHTTFDPTTNWGDLGLLRDDRIEVAGRMLPASYPGTDDALQLLIDGTADVGANSLFSPQTPDEQARYARGFSRLNFESQVIPNTTSVLADLPQLTTTIGESINPAFQVPRVRPPEIDAIHPDKETNRYWELTRDSGFWVPSGTTGFYYNTGEFGWGWANYGGIYIDNGPYVDESGNSVPGDIQYNHDLDRLRLNWTRSVGVHQPSGDARASGTASPPFDWWDKTGRYYAPPGVEIVLHGEAPCPYIEIVRHDYRGQPGSGSYWRGIDGTPITSELVPARNNVVSWQYTPQSGGCAPSAASQPFGIYDGNTARVPFPPNGVIYAEGNIRIRGIMPPVRSNTGGAGTALGADAASAMDYFGEWNATQGRTRKFDLQVVSGGTIYIEGDLLSPSSARLNGLVPKGAADDNTYYTNEKLYSSRLALLARDSVCVNTTALNPRPVYALAPQEDPRNAGTYLHYNDLQPPYSSSGNEGYQVFEGDPLPEHNLDIYGASWDRQPLPTSPQSITFTYTNPRLWVTDLAAQLADARLILGHSALYVAGATPQESGGFTGVPYDQDSGQPPADTDGPEHDQPSVQATLYVNDPAQAAAWPWSFGTSPYSFVRQDYPTADPTTKDQSFHWYLDIPPDQVTLGDAAADDWLEFLPNQYQSMLIQKPGIRPLGGIADIIQFVPRVMPVRQWNAAAGEYVGWKVPPKDLIYVLGPVAVAPLNRSGGNAVDPLPVEIDALIYAQNGSWFILPGRWFNDDPDEFKPDGSAPVSDYPGYHEPLNIRITVNGAISENMPADLGSVADWTSKWSGPAGQGEGFLTYVFDPLLRYPRFETKDRIGYLRFPNFPITSDLVIWGERVSGPAGS